MCYTCSTRSHQLLKEC